MNKELKKDLKRYIREIKANIICDFKTRNKFISDIKNSIDDYIENNKVDHIDEIYEHFGKPQEIAKEFFLNADFKKIKRRMNFTKSVIAGVVIAVLMLGTALLIELADSHMNNRGSGVEAVHDIGEYSFLEKMEENK